MRRKLPAILIFLSCLPAAPAVSASDNVVVANTPSGVGDPNAIVCRAPQAIAASGQLGPQICFQNSEWSKTAMDGKDLAPDGVTLIDRPTVDNPKGEGDPDAITCRTKKVISSSLEWTKRFSPVVCRPNSFWADAVKNHQMVDLNGKVRRRVSSTDYGPLYGPGGYPYSYPDSGNASQSSATPGTP